MKNRLFILFIFLFESLIVTGNPPKSYTVVFDMANAILTGNHVDIPVYFSSNDTISTLDFSLKYNELNFTYDSIINYEPSSLTVLANFNSSDRYLRLTSYSTNPNQQIENKKQMFAIRFTFIADGFCQTIHNTDINSITTYLNGNSCSYIVTTPLPFRIPIANFSNNKPCKSNVVSFRDSSTVIEDSITSWMWNFGNGKTSIVKNPSTTYTTTTVYTVTLIVTSDLGCSDTVTRPFQVNNSPIADFTYAADCPSGNIMFTDLSFISPPNNITDWSWNFGDGKPPLLHQQNPNYDYDYGGSYTATLTAISDSGCTSTYSHKVAITILSAIFRAKNGCEGVSVNFLDSSITAASAGAITNWKWYFGDGSTALSKGDTSHIYNDTGTYIVSLKVSNANCSDSIAHKIMIQGKPVVKFSEDKISGCMPLTINFSDSSITSSESTYLWNFGDKDTSSSKNTTHIYLNNGNYSVTHYVTTSAGCLDSLVKSSFVNVYGADVSFSASLQKVKLPNANVSFTNLTKSYTSWLWNFGDSTSTNTFNAQHTFADTGSYLVCLTGKDTKGCSSNHCDTIVVISLNLVAIPEAFTPNNDNINDVLKVRGGPVTEMEFRIFDEWGKQVFFSNIQSNGWEGTFNGSPQPVGVYEYTLKGITVFDNQTINMHGVVNLLR